MSDRSKASLLPHWDGAIYTKYAARFYDRVTTHTGWVRQLEQNALDGLAPGTLLDVGCGTGHLVSLATAAGFDAVGVDASEGMLEEARAKHANLSSRFHCATAQELPFESEHFDIVIASGCLVHTPLIKEAADEMLRVLKPGGIVRIIDHAVPSELYLSRPFFLVFCQLSGDIIHDYRYYFGRHTTEIGHRTLGRGGYLQRFDFKKD